jgi:hypothetical protein
MGETARRGPLHIGDAVGDDGDVVGLGELAQQRFGPIQQVAGLGQVDEVLAAKGFGVYGEVNGRKQSAETFGAQRLLGDVAQFVIVPDLGVDGPVLCARRLVKIQPKLVEAVCQGCGFCFVVIKKCVIGVKE